MFSGTAQFSRQVCHFFFVSSVCLLVRVIMVDTNKAVVCCLLATEETVRFPEWTAQFSVWKDDWIGYFWGLRCCLSKLRSLLSSRTMSHSKIAQFSWECLAPLIVNIIGIFYMVNSVPRERGVGGTDYRGPAFRNGARGPTMFHMFLPSSVVPLSAGCYTFTQNPSHFATDSQSFRFSAKIFSPSGLAGGPKPTFGGSAFS
jgi:hypothetical protein